MFNIQIIDLLSSFALMNTLLAVDLGVKTGYALYSDNGDLIRYHSHNFGNAQRLKKGVHGILKSCKNLQHLYIEGGGKLEKYWSKEAAKLGVKVNQLHAHDWRKEIYPTAKHQDKSKQTKIFAEKKALEILSKQNAPAPSSLTHDVAEAILIGYYACLQIGWINS